MSLNLSIFVFTQTPKPLKNNRVTLIISFPFGFIVSNLNLLVLFRNLLFWFFLIFNKTFGLPFDRLALPTKTLLFLFFFISLIFLPLTLNLSIDQLILLFALLNHFLNIDLIMADLLKLRVLHLLSTFLSLVSQLSTLATFLITWKNIRIIQNQIDLLFGALDRGNRNLRNVLGN